MKLIVVMVCLVFSNFVFSINAINLNANKYLYNNNFPAPTRISLSGSNAHDSQVLSIKSGLNQYTLVLYCSFGPNRYMLCVLDSKTNKVVLNTDILSDIHLGTMGWSPRFFQINSTTIRIVFTIDNTKVFYRDLIFPDLKLSSINPLKVSYLLKDGNHSEYVDLSLSVFSSHIKNSIKIDLDSTSFKSFSGKSILVDGTDQLQFVNSKYYLTLEVLSDNFGFGDCGGVACLMESVDLKNWTLKKPVYNGNTASAYRFHEMSMTYLNGNWNGLSRYNTDSINGYMYWTSTNGDEWKNNGLAPIPGATKGYRNSVCSFESNILKGKKMTAIAYQKFDSLDIIPFTDHSSQRRSIGICITEDFVEFNDILIYNDNNFNTYPSICILGDSLFLSWSSGKNSFVEQIKLATFNLNDLLIELEKSKSGDPIITNTKYFKKILYSEKGFLGLEYFLPFNGITICKIYDLTGKKIKEVKNGLQNEGYNYLKVNVSGLKTGIYFISLEYADGLIQGKFILPIDK